MRDENPLPLSVRHADDKKLSPKRRYFISFEGDKTEPRYFNEVVKCQKELGISSVIELHPLSRQNEARNLSHPKYALPLFVEALKEYESGSLTVGSAVGHFIEWLNRSGYIAGKKSVSLQKEQRENLVNRLKEKGFDAASVVDDVTSFAEVLCGNAECICSSVLRKARIEEFANVLKKQSNSFDKKYDRACYLMDRDELSVSAEDFHWACEFCGMENISLYVSHPRFELWLLLHFLSRKDLSIDELRNPSSGYLERCLGMELKRRGASGGYSKENYPAGKFVRREAILQAVKNEGEFCEASESLCDSVGCNVGVLMRELLGGVQGEK